MAKPYSPFSGRVYDVQFDKIAAKIKGQMAALLKKTAESCLLNIVNHEPAPFLTGSYIASHRVGINAEDTSDTVFEKEGDMSLEGARTRAIAELSKLENIKVDDTVYISNSVGYSTKYGYSWARNVEYQGWEGKKGGGRGSYLVYEQAALKAINDIPKHVQFIKVSGEGI